MALLATFVGVGKLDPDNRELIGTTRDAKALHARFLGTIPGSKPLLLADYDASADNIRKALQGTLGSATAADTVVFFLSGHGSHDQPAPAPGSFQPVPVGGTLVIPPQPNVVPCPLRPDQFTTLRDGEMSVSRSCRDVCLGALATGVVGLAGIALTIDLDVAAKQGRHPLGWIIGLTTMTGVAFVVALIEWIRMHQTQANSSYSRLVDSISEYFNISASQ